MSSRFAPRDRARLIVRAESDGRAGIADIKLTDDEVLARGPQMLVGYLHPEDETAAFDDDGFFRTGDLGRWEDDEFLVVTGRAKDIIIRNGENISPKELEDILVGHAGIAEIAVVGIPDERTGERACAVIVAAGQSRSTSPKPRGRFRSSCSSLVAMPFAIALSMPSNSKGSLHEQTRK